MINKKYKHFEILISYTYRPFHVQLYSQVIKSDLFNIWADIYDFDIERDLLRAINH
jgi:hypothetical protein